VHRRPLLDMLAAYRARHPEERACVDRMRALVEAHPDCFERTCLPGHVTASAWIVSADGERCLLTHHRKLGRWLQLGGHADGDPDPLSVALMEAREESGMEHFDVLSLDEAGLPIPLDVDVHLIPARENEPEHEHHDVRFLLRARAGQTITRSPESIDLQWFAPDEVAGLETDESVLRLARKAPLFLERA
jgi:8-oxo-dGTP pyrophosphatase MutT (NUDIX family)